MSGCNRKAQNNIPDSLLCFFFSLPPCVSASRRGLRSQLCRGYAETEPAQGAGSLAAINKLGSGERGHEREMLDRQLTIWADIIAVEGKQRGKKKKWKKKRSKEWGGGRGVMFTGVALDATDQLEKKRKNYINIYSRFPRMKEKIQPFLWAWIFGRSRRNNIISGHGISYFVSIVWAQNCFFSKEADSFCAYSKGFFSFGFFFHLVAPRVCGKGQLNAASDVHKRMGKLVPLYRRLDMNREFK